MLIVFLEFVFHICLPLVVLHMFWKMFTGGRYMKKHNMNVHSKASTNEELVGSSAFTQATGDGLSEEARIALGESCG